MSGVKATKKRIGKGNGSATVEAAIVLPVFLVVLFSLAYIIRIFYAYNTVQASLSEVARRIGNMSYFYHVSGLKDYSDQLNDMAQKAGGTLEDQKNIIVDAFGSFNESVSGIQNAAINGVDSVDNIKRLLDDSKNFHENMTGASDLVQSIVSDPRAELQLFMTIFAQKLSYEVTNRLVCFIAQGNLGVELNKRVKVSGGDAALSLGIKGGIGGMDFFEDSSVFGDAESLEFVVRYSIKAPVPFGLIPELQLSNRVKIIAWTGGRGITVKVENKDPEYVAPMESSIWSDMDQDKRFWDRGLEIEDIHVEKLVNEGKNKGLEAFSTAKDCPVIDAYTINRSTGEVVFYDVFTLNPHLKTYSTRPNTICYEIKKHGKRLLECNPPDGFNEIDVKSLKRIVVFIIPENSDAYAINAYTEACKELEKFNVEVRLVQDYGSYPIKEESTELAQAS